MLKTLAELLQIAFYTAAVLILLVALALMIFGGR